MRRELLKQAILKRLGKGLATLGKGIGNVAKREASLAGSVARRGANFARSTASQGANLARQGYARGQVGLGKAMTSPVGQSMMNDAGFLSSTGLLQHGAGSAYLPLESIGTQSYGLARRLLRR